MCRNKLNGSIGLAGDDAERQRRRDKTKTIKKCRRCGPLQVKGSEGGEQKKTMKGILGDLGDGYHLIRRTGFNRQAPAPALQSRQSRRNAASPASVLRCGGGGGRHGPMYAMGHSG
jgi:hypothetical protein